MNDDDVSEALARWTFIVTMIGTALYALAVYVFVLSANPEDDTPPRVTAEP